VSNTGRIAALDFVKGALVLVMVLYHWLNYFVEADYFYKYLRFLTPSFIFITGFIISHARLSKPTHQDGRGWRRLAHRGLKILAVFVVLNVIRVMLVEGASPTLSYDSFVRTYITGTAVGGGSQKAASFFILVPIAYLLFIASLLTVAVKYFRSAVHVACAISFLAVVLLAVGGKESSVLELVSAGLLGTSIGYIPIERIQAFARNPLFLVPLFVGYLVALYSWGEIYAIQIVGVLVMLMVIDVAYGDADNPGTVRQVVVLLGKYSLVGYIGQIAVLQILRRSTSHLDFGEATRYLALLGTVLMTLMIVWVTDRARSRVTAVDRLYVAVFG
jgi:heparan-alpha-glucosaminide N-acetyltransferase-like protein